MVLKCKCGLEVKIYIYILYTLHDFWKVKNLMVNLKYVFFVVNLFFNVVQVVESPFCSGSVTFIV